MEKRKPEAMKALSRAIGFTEDDLNANRDGCISERQRERLISTEEWWAHGMVTLLAILMLSLSTRNCVTAICLPFPVLFGLVYCWQQMLRTGRDRNGIVTNIQGVAHLESLKDENFGVRYTMDILDVHFRLDQQTFLAFKNGDPYAVYYAPHSQTLLSAEWLRE